MAQIVEYAFPSIGSYHALRGNPDRDIRRFKGLLIECRPKLLIFPSYGGGIGTVFREGSEEKPETQVFLVAPGSMTYESEDLLSPSSSIPKKFIKEAAIDDEFVDAVQGIITHLARNRKAEDLIAEIFKRYANL